MLRIADLTIAYGRALALSDFTIDVPTGSLATVIGPNGAGKSSLLLAIAGAVRPRSGAIEYNGHSIVGRKPEEIVGTGVMLVTEQRRLFKTFTVEENLRLAAASRAPGDYADAFARFPALRALRNTRAEALSGGEQQQLALARALLRDPTLLLLDEPSLGLAPKVVDQVFETIVDLRSTGMTVLLVEQHARRAIAVADQVAILAAGRTVAISAADHVADLGAAVESAYFGDHS
jgi:branched-chain amino acid transport system ATP-binding protein